MSREKLALLSERLIPSERLSFEILTLTLGMRTSLGSLLLTIVVAVTPTSEIVWPRLHDCIVALQVGADTTALSVFNRREGRQKCQGLRVDVRIQISRNGFV